MTDLSRVVLIPTYNESQNMRELVERIEAVDPGLDILIIDDNSPDGTADIAADLQKTHPRLHLLRRPAKNGLGMAYREAYAWALQRPYEIIAQMDGDLSHQPEELPGMIAETEKADLVLGSRYIPGGRTDNWSKWRRRLSQIGNAYARIVTGVPLRDITSGFRVFRRKVPEKVMAMPQIAKGYAFQIEVLFRTHASGFSISETPICFKERTTGKTKINFRIVAEALWVALRVRFGSG